jgi:hypothetical protein
MKKIKITIISSAFLTLVSVFPACIFAYTMGSSNYRIDSDSINVGGTNLSTSANYKVSDSVGEVATGLSSSTNYYLKDAGFWHYEAASSTYITINSPSGVSLPSISGLTGGVATSSSSWVVTTNNSLGYQMTVVASTSPALKSTNTSIPDYVPSGANPDFAFTVSSSQAYFGFSPEGNDIVQRYKDNGSSCNFGASDTANACWDGFSTISKVVAQSSSSNLSGATTTLKYRVEIGSAKIQDASNGYSASVTVTATTL